MISEKEAPCNLISWPRQVILLTVFSSINTLKLNEPSTGFPLYLSTKMEVIENEGILHNSPLSVSSSMLDAFSLYQIAK